MKKFEVEVKSLLGSKEAAEELKNRLKDMYPHMKLIGQGKQLNHYFNTPADLSKLIEKAHEFVGTERQAELKNILEHGQKMSIRTRDADGKVSFVIKASVGDGTSSNGTKRLEFECPVDMDLGELDQALIDGGCTYQAKWSREREEYGAGHMNICIDKNAGYGYLAEFERVTSDESSLDASKIELLSIMGKLGVGELPQDRLERMFAHYNAHWPEYYGTDNIFNIE